MLRSRTGSKDIIGQFVADAYYHPSLEGKWIRNSPELQRAVVRSQGWFALDTRDRIELISLLSCLQLTHDKYSIYMWPYYLGEIAKAFKILPFPDNLWAFDDWCRAVAQDTINIPGGWRETLMKEGTEA